MRAGTRRQHHQPVEAQRGAARRRHVRERGEELLVDGIALAVDALLLGHLRLEAPALQVGIGQLAEGVGQLHAAGIKLEALGDARVGRLGPRQRGQMRGILGQQRGPAIAEVGLDPLDENAAEDIAPRVVVGHADAAPHPPRPRKCASIRSAQSPRVCEQIDAGITR